MDMIITLLVLLLFGVSIGLVVVIRLYRQLRYIVLCRGFNTRFKEGKGGTLLGAVDDTAFVTVTALYGHLSSPTMSQRRIDMAFVNSEQPEEFISEKSSETKSETEMEAEAKHQKAVWEGSGDFMG